MNPKAVPSVRSVPQEEGPINSHYRDVTLVDLLIQALEDWNIDCSTNGSPSME